MGANCRFVPRARQKDKAGRERLRQSWDVAGCEQRRQAVIEELPDERVTPNRQQNAYGLGRGPVMRLMLAQAVVARSFSEDRVLDHPCA